MLNCCAWLRQVPPQGRKIMCDPWLGISQPAWFMLPSKFCSKDQPGNKKQKANLVSKLKAKYGWKSSPLAAKIMNKASSTNTSIAKKIMEPFVGEKQSEKVAKKRTGLKIFLTALSGCIMWAIYEMGQPEQDTFGRPIEDELSPLPMPQQYLQRMWRSLHYYQQMLKEPLPTKLLPDELQAPYIQPRYTLVLEMRDVLVHPDWTYQTGWRFKKRPGVDHFLRQCSKNFEIVVYTSEQGMTAFPILDALDPNGYIRYRLVRDATQLVEGHHVKNLNRLNRNLKRIIVVDWDRKAIPLHQDNIFAIVRWLGNDDDVQLFDLAAFLGLIAEHKVCSDHPLLYSTYLFLISLYSILFDTSPPLSLHRWKTFARCCNITASSRIPSNSLRRINDWCLKRSRRHQIQSRNDF